ncbi:MAG TPA: hypothetical protein VGR27_06075 [Longimicrobiaceae bacterium]|nr:hypothetical protein [Longimicrobiaceae bacterium]
MNLLLALFVQTTAAEAAAREGLSTFALTFMLLSMAAVTALTVWCYAKILSGKTHFDPDGTGPAHSPVPGEADSTRGPRRG